MKIAFVVLLAVHGLVHLLGPLKAFGLAELAGLTRPIARSMGVVWALAAAAMLATAVTVALDSERFVLVAAPALVLSQVAIISSWHDAKFGTLANLVLALPLALALLELRPNSFGSRYEADAALGLARPVSEAVLTDADLAPLPALLATYLKRTGAVGRPLVRDFHARFSASMKRSPDAAFMEASAEQYEFYAPRARLFLMRASVNGLPFAAYHRYVGGTATMQVRVASLFDIVNASGPEMNQSETVTLFNDMCLFAPSSLLGVDVKWQPLDAHRLRGTFTNAGHTIRAELVFDAAGDLADFVSDDRFLSADGKHYERRRWLTPVSAHGTFGGRRAVSQADAVWTDEQGARFVYARFQVESIEYNVSVTRSSASERVAKNAAPRPGR